MQLMVVQMGNLLIWLNKVSIVIPITLTLMMLFLHFINGAIEAGKVEMAKQEMERLSQLSLAELGQIRVNNGKAGS
jgi:hypothetical protein